MDKFKKDLVAKIILTFAAVNFLNALYWISSSFKESASDFARRLGGGVSLVLLGYGVFQAFRLYMLKIDEKKLEELYIRSKDERNIMIREKTSGSSFTVSVFIICIAIMIFSYISTMVTIVLVGLLAAMFLVRLILKMYYEKKY